MTEKNNKPWFSRLWAKHSKGGTDENLHKMELGSGFYLTYNEAPNSHGGYCKVSLTLHNKNIPEFHSRITDKRGRFLHFPGYVNGSWEQKLDSPFTPCVEYQCYVGPFEEGKALFEWMVQPDGWYFADSDGFGAEKCEEVWLCSFIDEKGKFTEPFSYMLVVR